MKLNQYTISLVKDDTSIDHKVYTKNFDTAFELGVKLQEQYGCIFDEILIQETILEKKPIFVRPQLAACVGM